MTLFKRICVAILCVAICAAAAFGTIYLEAWMLEHALARNGKDMAAAVVQVKLYKFYMGIALSALFGLGFAVVYFVQRALSSRARRTKFAAKYGLDSTSISRVRK